MIQMASQCTKKVCVTFYSEGDGRLEHLPDGVRALFDGGRMRTAWRTDAGERMELLVGLGELPGDRNLGKEAAAKAAKECKERKIKEYAIDLSSLWEKDGIRAVRDVVEGVMLGNYEQRMFKETENETAEVELCGIPAEEMEKAETAAREAEAVAEGVCFARDMVNLPGNKLRPTDFAQAIVNFVEGLPVETEVLDAETLHEMGMEAMLAVGDSSAYPPCLLVLRYRGDAQSEQITGLVGKGVTDDTGGYCLKPAASMMGMKGDMAGGAAVSAAVYALAKNQVKTNVTAVIPMCENRISSGSMLPGDVIRSYAGKTIEIANTDAEGRLMLADAVAYAVRKEQVTEVLDIATLTGSVVSMFGFSIAGVLCDDDRFYEAFQKAYERSGERYWRLPFYAEHEKMIESPIADLCNMGENVCGTITAGLFIRAFAEERPWMHLDIAGTAWAKKPIFEFQSKGATGAGVTSIYELCSRRAD